jgi:hypothetical protein
MVMVSPRCVNQDTPSAVAQHRQLVTQEEDLGLLGPSLRASKPSQPTAAPTTKYSSRKVMNRR